MVLAAFPAGYAAADILQLLCKTNTMDVDFESIRGLGHGGK